jgi:PAS domain S-box-containing protein
VEVLRQVTPVQNSQECHMCHDPLQKWNGLLVIDFPTSHLKAQLSENLRNMLSRAGLMTLAVLVVLGLLMNKVVIGRLHKLTRATGLVARRKEVPQLTDLEGPDEIGRLAISFKKMAEHLSSSFRELESQKVYLQELIDSLQDGLVVVDSQSNVELANRAALQSLGKRTVVGLSLNKIGLEAAARSVSVSFQKGEPTRMEARLMLQESCADCEIYSSPVWDQRGMVARVIVLFRDITQRRMLEKQLSRTERLASVGQLAAGLAHEINNPMAAIHTCAEGLDRYIDSGTRITPEEKHEIRDYILTIGEAAFRCKEITQRLLSVSADKAEVSFQEVDLAETVKEVVTLLDHEAGKKHVLIKKHFEGETKILGAPEKLFQLLLNLALNSLEATADDGRILVSVRRKIDYIELKVSDRGRGISTDHLDRIFDPFFTTKAEGRGTGLGLSICEGIVRQHQGQISVRSEVDQGTEVTVLFPGLGED